MKRLLCIINEMTAGGAETFLMKLYRQFDLSKYQMDFCVHAQNRGFYDDEIEAMGGKIYRIPSKSENLWRFRHELTYLIRTQGYQYVIRITSSGLGMMDLMIAKRAGAKVCVARSSNSSDGGGWKAWMAHRVGRLLYERYVDVKLAPSDLSAIYTFGEDAYQRNEIYILHNALDLEMFCFDEVARTALRDEWGIAPHTTLVGHIGRFSRQKNHVFLLEVFAEIHQQNKDSILILVGAGEFEETIKKKVCAMGLNECVRFIGVRSDIPKILSAMDVFVFPSLYEGMPNVVIEAQACSLPCVIADTITQEADITGLVRYLPLNNARRWADVALLSARAPRVSVKDAFMKNGYEIKKNYSKFARWVFGDEV